MSGTADSTIRRFNNVVERTLAYCFGLGWLTGTRLLITILASRLARRESVTVRLAGVSDALFLRPCSSDVTVFTQTFARREYDMATMRHAQDTGWLDPSRSQDLVVVDCGANIGLSTVWFAREFPHASIVAIEPEVDNFRLLERNARAYGARCICAGVWNEKTTLHISNPRASRHAFQVSRFMEPESDNARTIEAITLNEVVAWYPNRRFLVKIDIEGAESALFHDNIEWLDAVDLLIVEIHDWLMPWQGTSLNVLKAIVAQKFEVQWRGENLFCFRTGTSSGGATRLLESSLALSVPVGASISEG